VSYGIGFMIETLVAILLGITIAYCIILNNRLKRLKADEQSLRATISELITATEIAERAVAGLKLTAHECEHTLGERLKAADRFCSDLSKQVKGGEMVLSRLARVVVAAQSLNDVPAVADAPDPKALAAAARSFADRQRDRNGSLAA
jgi:hypothetical protein